MSRAFPLLPPRLLPRFGRAAVRLLYAAAGLALGTVLGAALVLLPPALTPAPAPHPPALPPVPRLSPSPPPPPTALAPGLKFPPLTSRWLNGPRPAPLAPTPDRVTVVDVWADW